MDIDLYKKIAIEDFIERMNKELPEGIKIIDAKYIEDNRSISSLISWSFYEIKFIANGLKNKEAFQDLIDNWLKNEKIIIKKIRRKGRKITERDQDIKLFIGNIIIKHFSNAENSNSGAFIVMDCLLKAGDNGNLKPKDFIEAMEKYLDIGVDFDSVDIKRLQLFAEEKGRIVSPM